MPELTCTQSSQCGAGTRCVRIGNSGYCDVTRSASGMFGGGGGSSFARTCRNGEVMVGVSVRSGWWIDSIAPRCVSVTNTGAWNGAVRTLARTGGGGGDHTATLDCPNHFAVSGIAGRSGSYVDQLSLECRRLVNQNTFQVADTPQTIGPAGGDGGDDFGPYHCAGQLPVISLNGRSATYVDQVNVVCGR
jgi:hypothetical protein